MVKNTPSSLVTPGFFKHTLIITGHQRSGTTLLRNLFTSHPDVILTNEFGNYFGLNQPNDIYSRLILKRWWAKRNNSLFPERSDLGAKIKGVNLTRNLVFISRYLMNINRNGEAHTTVDTIADSLLKLFPGTKIVGDKHPDYWFQMDNLAKIDSLNRLLIIRDPRDVAYSVVQKARGPWKDSWPKSLQDVGNVARRWVRMVEAMKRNEDAIFTIRYEDLVTNPISTLNQFGDWLDIDPSGFRHEVIRADSIGKYNAGLSCEEIKLVNDIAGQVSQQVGYEL
jgi:hypothetical protein